MIEHWLPVPDWEGLYEVSDQGRVRSIARTVVRRDGTTQRWRAREMGRFRNSLGYLMVRLSDAANGRRKVERVHRLVATAFIANPLHLPEVNHIDGDKANPRVGNLQWTTPHGNRKHAWDTGLRTRDHLPVHRGENASSARLTELNVIEARRLHCEGVGFRRLAARFGVGKKTIAYAVKGITWSHVPPPLPTREPEGR